MWNYQPSDTTLTKYLLSNPDIFLLNLFGLWPHQSNTRKKLNFILFILCCTSLVIVLIIGLTQESSNDKTIFVETLMGIITVIGGFLQYVTLYAKGDLLKSLYDESDINWDSLTDVTEIAIFTKFVHRGRLLSYFHMGAYALGFTSFSSLAIIPRFLAMKESKDYSQLFPYYAKNLVIHDDARNFQVFNHSWLVSVYACSVYVLVSSVFAINVARICAIYAITRLKKLIKFDQTHARLTNSDREMIQELITITTMHKKAIKRVHIISNTFSNTFFVVQVCLLMCTSLFIFDISYNINTISVLKLSFITSTFIVYMFGINYGGEQIRQFSKKILLATYEMPWYLLSIKARKNLIMIILRSGQGDILNAGILQLSLANFTSIMKIAWSVATVLSSINTKSE